MNQSGELERQFDQSRAHLRAVAYRMLGSPSDADDAVQEAWLKLNRSDAGELRSVRGWLTTVVARVCLDMLRARRSRREESLTTASDTAVEGDPETDLMLGETIGPAMLIVLDRLSPSERVTFVLHDMFDLSFEELAPIVNRTPAAARQLASRARRRVRGAQAPPADNERRRELVAAFLAASREGDFEGLLAVLSPDAVLHADDLAVRTASANRQHGAPSLAAQVRGASPIAKTFKGRARGASAATIDGQPAALWATGGQIRALFVFTIEADRIAAIDIIMEPASIAARDVEID